MRLLSRSELRTHMSDVLTAQGRSMPTDEGTDLRTIEFRSLDFSELALRVEDAVGHELNFDAPGLRQITTVGDMLDFLEQLQSA